MLNFSSRLCALLVLLLAVTGAAAQSLDPQIIAALKTLKTASPDDRQKIYDLVAVKGNASLIPLLSAYKDGGLLLHGDRLARYGDRVSVPGQGSMLPLIDAITSEPIKGADGKPLYFAKVDLTDALRRPLPHERVLISDLISALSLNDPDPDKRRDAIAAAADRMDVSLLPALKSQLAADPNGKFSVHLKEAIARIEIAGTDPAVKFAAAKTLTDIRSMSSMASLQHARNDKSNADNKSLLAQLDTGIAANESYQSELRFISTTFAGLSLSSILILLALGLSIIFGLMGVINMAHGEFMMVGAFTTFVVSEFFKNHFPGAFDYYPIAAVPAAFLVSGLIGWLCEICFIRFLYGRPLDTLLATWGISLILIQSAQSEFGNNLSITPPSWMVGGWEVMHDLILPLNRVYIIIYCVICITVVWLVVNKTKLGLLLRATTQNREMSAALGVPTRRVDALTFAFGAGLAGLAGVVVPMFDKINPHMGEGYIVDSFMVVVVGGVGKLAGAIWAGLGFGFINKYLEPLIGGTGSVIYSKIIVLVLIILFLQKRPSGLFPAKGRMADA